MKYAPIRVAAARALTDLHAANCRCPRCMHHGGYRADPRERRVRVAMFTLAIVIGGLLGHTVTPQQIAVAIVGAVR